MKDIIDELENKIIVSVQAEGNEPLNSPEHLLALSQAVIAGGASCIRLCGIKNINYIKKRVPVPVIGLTKLEPTPINWLDSVYITASLKDLNDLLKTEIEIVAIDGTNRLRSDNSTLKDQIGLIKEASKIVMCDIATFEDAMYSIDLGADLISTTLSGYTKDTRYKANEGPDFDLLSELIQESEVPIIMEGRIWDPQDVKKAFEIGAHAVVIGSAITKPHMITKRFVSAIPFDKN